MTSRHLVDPELLPGLEFLPSIDFSAETLPIILQALADMRGGQPAPVLIADMEVRHIPAPDGHSIALAIHRPKERHDAPLPVVVHMHGGGYILGSAQTMLDSPQKLAVAANAIVVSVDYRLAPDTCHPGPINDCYAALRWVYDNADALGADKARIAVAGESAGGGLAAALALLARDRAEVPLVHQHLIYPMLDDRTCARTADAYAGEFVWTHASNHFGWRSLLGVEPGSDRVSPYAAAARADNLAGLPPAFIYVGALDLFAQEDLDYAARLMRAGVPTELHVLPGAFHGFDLVENAQMTKAAVALSMAALRRALA